MGVLTQSSLLPASEVGREFTGLQGRGLGQPGSCRPETEAATFSGAQPRGPKPCEGGGGAGAVGYLCVPRGAGELWLLLWMVWRSCGRGTCTRSSGVR